MNDYANWRLFLSPVKNRDPDLGEHVIGLMSNPMKQSEVSKLPLGTIGAYLRDPERYQATAAMQKALKDLGRGKLDSTLSALVEVYGSHFLGEPGFNQPPPTKGPEEAQALKAKLTSILAALSRRKGFQRLAAEVLPAVKADLQRVDRRLAALEGPHAPPINGMDFSGGAGELYGFDKFDREGVNYIYAAATDRSEMTAKFLIEKLDVRKQHVLVLEARDDDFPSKAHVRIQLNKVVLFEGKSDFPDDRWEAREFRLPPGALRAGENVLTIRCTDEKGVVGMPPWFMVSRVEVKQES